MPSVCASALFHPTVLILVLLHRFCMSSHSENTLSRHCTHRTMCLWWYPSVGSGCSCHIHIPCPPCCCKRWIVPRPCPLSVFPKPPYWVSWQAVRVSSHRYP